MNIERLNEIEEYHNKGMTLPFGAIPELLAFTRSQLEAQAVATETPKAES
jgi:hypothetical protein